MRKVAGVLALVGFSTGVLAGQVADTIPGPLQQGQYDLAGTGRAFLLDEASRASFFMLGELHGENEIPALIRNVWPSMMYWADSYDAMIFYREVTPLGA